jgi:presenilin-like A22 family membrane protease
MRYFESLVLVCSIYLVTIVLALNTAAYILPLMYPPQGGEPEIEPVFKDPENVGSGLSILAYIVFMTAVMLVLLRFGLGFIINFALLFSYLAGTYFTFSAIFGEVGLFFSIGLLITYIFKRGSMVVSNIVLILTLSGVGAILGGSLGVAPVIVLVIAASVYDFIAVFVTKHMVTLAKGGAEKLNMIFLIPVGRHILGLGAGDIALPATFVVSVYARHGAGYAIGAAFGGVVGLASLFYYILERKGTTLPALPPIVAGLLIGYGSVLILA